MPPAAFNTGWLANRHRRWLKIGLRSLFLPVAVVALLVAWQFNHVRQQRSVVAQVSVFDAEVVYDFRVRGEGRPPGPAWLRRLFGDDFFADVVGIEIHDARIDDETLAAITTLPRLRFLVLQEGMSDQAIVRLGDAELLERLQFRSPLVTDAGLAQLAEIKSLISLSIAAPHVTDVGLIPLEDMPNLGNLELFSTEVTQAGVERLQSVLPNCDIFVSPEPAARL